MNEDCEIEIWRNDNVGESNESKMRVKLKLIESEMSVK